MKHKRIIIISLAVIAVFTAAGLSRPVKTAITRILPAARTATPQQAGPSASPSPQRGPDVEQRARAAHGWTPAIQDSAVTGSINFYNRSGDITRQGAIRILRNYPDMLRVEITSNGATEIFGFDHAAPWN